LDKAFTKYNKINTLVCGVKIFYWAQHRDDSCYNPVEHAKIYTRNS